MARREPPSACCVISARPNVVLGGNGIVSSVRRWWAEYRPGTTLDVVRKDLRAIVGECVDRDAPLPLTASCLQFLMDAWEGTTG